MNTQDLLALINQTGQVSGELTTVKVDRDDFTNLCDRLNREFDLRLALFYATDQIKESKTFTLYPCLTNSSTIWLPMNPAPPVTKIVSTIL